MRYWVSRLVVSVVTRAYLRVRTDDRGRLPAGPAIYCFNHLGWADPFVLMAVLPFRPRLFFFGPKEEDMQAGGRNRLMGWTGTPIPYKPGKDDLLRATRRVSAVLAAGGVVAIAGEGRIHAGESELWPLSDGAAYFALRAGCRSCRSRSTAPAGSGSVVGSRSRVGEPLPSSGRANREAVDDADPANLGRRCTTWFATRPDLAAAGSIRSVAHRGLQRVARGIAGATRRPRAPVPVAHRRRPPSGPQTG